MGLTIGTHAAAQTAAMINVAVPQLAFAFITPTSVGPKRHPHE